MYGQSFTKEGHLRSTALIPGSFSVVQECNPSCRCSDKCKNRVVQNGIQVKMEVFKSEEKGLALRTLVPLRCGQFVCEYAGEILTEAEAKRRLGSLTGNDMNYMFILREHFHSGVVCTYIDPRARGNIGRFINHSCEPNLSIVPVRIFNMVPRVCLFASRDICAGEELTYNYGQSGGNLSDNVCKCGVKTCKGYLPFDYAVT